MKKISQLNISPIEHVYVWLYKYTCKLIRTQINTHLYLHVYKKRRIQTVPAIVIYFHYVLHYFEEKPVGTHQNHHKMFHTRAQIQDTERTFISLTRTDFQPFSACKVSAEWARPCAEILFKWLVQQTHANSKAVNKDWYRDHKNSSLIKTKTTLLRDYIPNYQFWILNRKTVSKCRHVLISSRAKRTAKASPSSTKEVKGICI